MKQTLEEMGGYWHESNRDVLSWVTQQLVIQADFRPFAKAAS
jgi:hypothetical protein